MVRDENGAYIVQTEPGRRHLPRHTVADVEQIDGFADNQRIRGLGTLDADHGPAAN
jgi:hypothetical protein